MGCGGSKISDERRYSTEVQCVGVGDNKRIVDVHTYFIDDNEHQEEDKGRKCIGVTTSAEIEELLSTLCQGELFCDPDFPADEGALFYSDQVDQGIKWARPQELVPESSEPHLLVDGISRDDIKQGLLGDCWFLSSCAAVSQQERFMRKIIPDDQPLCGPSYQGVVHFRFWRFGQWVDVYVDDRLPVKDGQLIYARCDDPNEFWVALVEKAYAKLHGCYEAIEGGQTMDALVDLTGGLAERYMLKGADPNMYRHLLRAHRAGAFIACTRKGDWRQSTRAEENGLVAGHAYTITTVMRIAHAMGEERLLRIRNPWGNETEWKGSWSDHDSNWSWVGAETLRLMQVAKKDDGEFWMSYQDFCRHFQEVTICTMGPDFDGDGIPDHAGHVVTIKGAWIENVSAGGSRNDLQMFATNPQYVISLIEPDDFDSMTDDPENQGRSSVVIALMQIQKRSQRYVGLRTLQIGFILYKTENPAERLTAADFKGMTEAGKSGIYINLREVSGRFELEPANYVIVPSSFKPHQDGRFMLRIFAQKRFAVTRLK